MRQTNAALACGGMLHWRFNHGLRSFFEHTAHRLVRDSLDHLELDELVREQAEGPAGRAVGWRAAGEGDQAGLLGAIDLALVLAARCTTVEGCFEPLLDKLFADARDGRLADLNSVGNGIVDQRVH